MGWRIICIEQANRINYKLNSIGILQNDETVWINLNEIDMIIIESQLCNTSIKLLAELSKKGISLLICGDDHMPNGLLTSVLNNNRAAKYNRLQLEWKQEIKQLVWKKIIKHKILLQMMCLIRLNKKDKINVLKNYIDEVQSGDLTNREGLAAKVYFHELFGLDFIRKRDADDIINTSLNYMYQVVRSKIAQEIVAHGYLPTIGIFHSSEYNYFGLADDLIEIFRPIVDYYVIELINMENIEFLTPLFKEKLLNIMYKVILYRNIKNKIFDAIRLFVIDVMDIITNNTIEYLTFPTFYDED